MKYLFLTYVLLIASCQNGTKLEEKKELLVAEYHNDNGYQKNSYLLTLLSDSTFVFNISDYEEYRHEKKEVFRGRYFLNQDTINFSPWNIGFVNSNKAIIRNNYFDFLDGKFQFRLKVIKTNINPHINVDTTKFNDYAIFTYDQKFHSGIQNEGKVFDLKTSDMIVVDSLLNLCILQNSNQISKKLKSYFKQVVAVKTPNNEVVVWVNLSCSGKESQYLFYNIIDSHDGGDCFFNVKINLNTLKYYDLSVNGDA